MITRRNIIPAALGLAIPSLVQATGSKPPKCECKCEGKPGPKGDTGPMGPAGPKGECNCKPKTPISIHLDAEYYLQSNGFPIPTPDITVPTPSNGVLANELWYFKNPNACVFFDYNHSSGIPHFIVFFRAGELNSWDKITPLGDKVWNWIAQNPTTGRAHICIVSLDKIISNPARIIQGWTPIDKAYLTFGTWPNLIPTP